jgi:ACS family hexuronate transporter-like MFS transporter
MNLPSAVPGDPELAAVPPKERLRMTPLQMALIGLLACSALINYVDRQATSVISPLLIAEFRLSDAQWGWVNAVFALTYIGTSALGGYWIDRIGVRKGLAISTLFWSIAAAGHALAGGLAGLCFWRAMLAVGEGPGGASTLKGVRRVLPLRLQDTGTSIVGAGTFIGALIAPLTVAPLAVQFGWRAAFVLTAAVGLLWVPVWLVLARRPEANLEHEGHAKPAAASPGVLAGDRPEYSSEPPLVPEAETVTPPGQDRLDFRSPAIWATAWAIFFVIPPSVFTLTFLARYLNQAYGIPVKELALLQWQPFLAMDIGQLLGGWVLYVLLRRGWPFLTARRLVMSAGFTGATLMILMTVAPSLTWAMVWLNLSRFSFQFAYVALLAYGISCVPVRQAGRMNGFMNATFGACGFVFSPLIGGLADAFHHDFRPALVMVSLSPLVGLAGWLLLSRRGPDICDE